MHLTMTTIGSLPLLLKEKENVMASVEEKGK